jgi:fatty acid synthase subunit beta
MSDMMIKNNLVKIKELPPYTLEQEDATLLNSAARATPDVKTGSYIFKTQQTHVAVDSSNAEIVSKSLSPPAPSKGCVGVGVDQG